MARRSKLLAALEAHKGRDYKLERQKKLQKHAIKKKKSNLQVQTLDTEDGQIGGAPVDGNTLEAEAYSEGWESDESGNAVAAAVGWHIAVESLLLLTN